jgi:hypothetical protein
MSKSLSLLFLFAFLSLASISQTNIETEKECRIISGIGFAGATKNTKSIGQYLWFQFGYKLSKNISFATEFENMTYNLRGYYTATPPGLDEIKSVDNNFSLLFKYYVLTDSRLKVAVASGWTYAIRTSEYYNYEINGTTEHWYRDVRSIDNYQIPLLLELEYPLWKKVNVQARAKYNLNPRDGSTYSSGIGLSLKL